MHNLNTHWAGDHLKDLIREYSSLVPNRFYTKETGEQASQYLYNRAAKYASPSSNGSVRKFQHKWRQPSVIARINGTESPDELVIIGAHLDSISGTFLSPRMKAPGADDDASGSMTLMEILRILTETGFKVCFVLTVHGCLRLSRYSPCVFEREKNQIP